MGPFNTRVFSCLHIIRSVGQPRESGEVEFEPAKGEKSESFARSPHVIACSLVALRSNLRLDFQPNFFLTFAMATNGYTAFQAIQPRGVIARKYGATLAWEGNPLRIELLSGRIQSAKISPEAFQEKLEQRRAVDRRTAKERSRLECLRKELEIGASAPPEVMESVLADLNELCAMESYVASKYTMMQERIDELKYAAEKGEPIEAMLRKENKELREENKELREENKELREENKELREEKKELRQKDEKQQKTMNRPRDQPQQDRNVSTIFSSSHDSSNS